MKALEADIVVVGAGLVGLSAAIAFTQQGKSVILVDAKKLVIKLKKAWDERVYALTPATENWLKGIGVWAHVDSSRVCDINAMHMFDETNQSLTLRDEDANLPKLGVIIENQQLMHALLTQVNALNVTLITDASCQKLQYGQDDVTLHLKGDMAIRTKLIVAADGVDSWLRREANIGASKKDFHQIAIVANFKAEKSHGNVARQWFHPHETLALLPLPNQHVSMVWAVSTEKASELLIQTETELAQTVLAESKGVLGDLRPAGKPLSFVLNQQTANSLIAKRLVLMGDAAHQIHPMAGQGVNLGFRDVIQLSSQLTKCHAMMDIGEQSFLRQYERARKADVLTMNSLTSGLDWLFASESSAVKKMTQWGFYNINKQLGIKKRLLQQVAA
jgi:2-polyprenylphenol 6-hydroxylase